MRSGGCEACLWVMGGIGQTEGVAPRATSTLEELTTTGVVKIEGVFSQSDAERMRDVVWRDLHRTDGVDRDDPATWHRQEPLKKLARAKRDPAFQAIFGASLRRLADEVLGEGWSTSSAFGNLLVSFPDAQQWHLPGRDGFWHSDLGGRHDPGDLFPTLRVFAVFGEMPAGCGGTLLVEGSDALIRRYIEANPTVERSLKADVAWHRDIPWLRDLTLATLPTDADWRALDERRRRFMEQVTEVDGIPCRVVEVSGQPGDIFVCAPWTLHCKPPNASDRPRFIRAPSLARARGARPSS